VDTSPTFALFVIQGGGRGGFQSLLRVPEESYRVAQDMKALNPVRGSKMMHSIIAMHCYTSQETQIN
jgi:hypothetical protein